MTAGPEAPVALPKCFAPSAPGKRRRAVAGFALAFMTSSLTVTSGRVGTISIAS
ncbi:MAG: hypothetical protein IPI61_08650 [Syntrophaceae bacterium]|nr:hypothetical protein [Syntrophaceae bacterium]